MREGLSAPVLALLARVEAIRGELAVVNHELAGMRGKKPRASVAGVPIMTTDCKQE